MRKNMQKFEEKNSKNNNKMCAKMRKIVQKVMCKPKKLAKWKK